MGSSGDHDAELIRAVNVHRRGNASEAERLYRAVLRRKPSDPIALSNIGILFAQSGRMPDAVEEFKKVVAAFPSAADKRLLLANALNDLGNLREAVFQYREVIRLEPNSVQAKMLCANALLRFDRVQEAIPLYRKCLEAEPRNANLLMNLGVALHQAGDYEQAIRCHRSATRVAPGTADAWFNLGESCFAIGDYLSAIPALETGLKIKSSDATAWIILAESLTCVNALDGALGAIENAVSLDRNNHKAMFIRGCVLQLQHRSSLAVEAYREVIKRVPDQASAHFNLGIVLGEQGRTEESKNEFESASSLSSGFVADAALIRRSLVVPVIAQSVEEIIRVRERLLEELRDLADRSLRVDDPQTKVGNPAFFLAYQGKNNRELAQEIARLMIASTPDLVWTAPHVEQSSGRAEKIKLAFISGHLREHTVGRITAGLIEKLDRSKFDVILMRPAGSSDSYSAEIDATADKVVDLPAGFRQAREAIANERLDAIYFPDIGMEPFTYYLAFSRLASVQAVGWGHADTTGIPNVDLYISSRLFEPPNAQEQYTERLVCLPRINCFYPRMPEEFESVSRAELGLPENVSIYLCPQSEFKLHPDFDEAIGEILRKDPRGIVVLITGSEPHWTDLLQARFQRTVPDSFDRIRFIPRVAAERFRGLLRLADAVIDPRHFTGGHTTYIAFGAGVPIVTWNGDHMRGRMTMGLYRQMGILGPVADSAEQFAEFAVRLANDREWHERLGAEVASKASVLFEDFQAVRDFENAMIDAVKTAQSSDPVPAIPT